MKRRDNGKRHATPKQIICHCPECQGRAWSLTEIRHAYGAGGGNPDQVVNGLTLPKIAKLLGHPLRYLNETPAGKWTPSAPVAREDGTRGVWKFAWDADVIENEMPINGARIPCALDSGREPEGGR